MAGYAIGHMREVDMGPEIVEYLERIDETLEPYEGRFLVHGAWPDLREGTFEGGLVVIEFPDLERAREWYASPAYQAIIPLRAEHFRGAILLVDGVTADHKATDVLT